MIRFYSDSGHGWYAVPVASVRASGAKISPYSYTDGKVVYLEEDCDIGAYLKAAGISNEAARNMIVEEPSVDRSFIRELRSYRE